MEVEIKVKIENIEILERRIKDMGSIFIKDVVEEDEYFNHPCRNFSSTDEALRIRNDNTLTYKGPKVDKDTKSREEINVEINNIKSTRKLLISLGFNPVTKVIKRRKYYKLGDLTISLDRVKELGDFIEIECIGEYNQCREKVLSLTRELSLSDFIRESYLELLLKKRSKGE